MDVNLSIGIRKTMTNPCVRQVFEEEDEEEELIPAAATNLIEKENENHDLLYYQTKLAEISNQITLDISASLGLVLESSDTEPF